MTRPRAEQLNDPETRYSKYDFRVSPTPGSIFTDIQNDGINNDYEKFLAASSTGLVTGLEEDISAIIIGTSTDPFTGLAPGDSFTITLPNVNSGTPIPIVLTGSEFVTLNAATVTTSSRVAALVNTTLAGFGITVEVASRAPGGFLRFRSANSSGFTTGDNASITVSAVTPGILTALGLGPSTTIQKSGSNKTRGVITRSNDGFGGYTIPYFGPRKAVTNSKVFVNSGRNGSTQSVAPAIEPQQPVIGRVTKTDGTFLSKKITLSWKAKLFKAPSIRSTLSNFTTIVPGDGFTILFIDPINQINQSVVISFTSTPVTVNDVVTQINNSWHSSNFGRVGAVQSTVFEPYIPYSARLSLILNGNPTITISFTGSERTAAEVAAKINTAISTAGQAAQGNCVVLNNKILIQSLSVTGASSTVEIAESSNPELLKSLGLQVGVYQGFDICIAEGAEIVIRPPSTSASYSLVSSIGSTISRLGLTGQIPAFPTFRAYEDEEMSVPFPNSFISESASLSSTLLGPGQTSVSFSEFMEAGDVPDNSFTINELIGNTGITNPFPTQNAGLRSNGLANSDVFGQITQASIPASIQSIAIGNARIGGNNSKSPVYLGVYNTGVYSIINEYKSVSVNRTVRDYVNDVGSAISFEKTVNAINTSGSSFVKDDNALASSIVKQGYSSFDFGFRQAGAGTFTWSYSAGFAKSSLIAFSSEIYTSSGVFREKTGTLYLSDANIVGGSSPFSAIPLSSNTASNGDTTVRVGEKESSIATALGFSILRAVNSRPWIVCGDGVDSFGDFNGQDAILDAATFLNTASITSATIYVKRGTYAATNTISFSDKNINLIGDPGATILTPLAGGGDTIFLTSSTKTNEFHISGIRVENSTATKKAIKSTGVVVKAENCWLNDVHVIIGTPVKSGACVQISNSIITGKEDAVILEYNTSITASPVVFENCLINNVPANTRCLVIRGINAASQFKPITFRSCEFRLAPYTAFLDGATGYGLSTKNTGLVDLDPQNNGRVTSGLEVDALTFEDCKIAANSSNFSCALQLPHLPANLIPTDAGNFGVVKKLNLIRCTFLLRYAEVGNTNIFNPFSTGTGAEEVNVEDVDFVMQAGTGGGGLSPNPPAWASWTVNEGVSGEPGFGTALFTPKTAGVFPWGVIAFMSRRINVRNMRIKNAFRKSFYGDVTFRYGHLHVDGLSVDYSTTNAGTGVFAPIARASAVEVRNAGGNKSTIWPGYGNPNFGVRNVASIKNVRFETFNVSAGNYWTTFPGAMFVGFGKYMDIDKVTSVGGSENNLPPGVSSGGGILVGSADISNPLVTGSTDIKIHHCDLRYMRYGIWYLDTQNFSDDSGGAQITDNYISYTSYLGIAVYGPWFGAAPVVPFTPTSFKGIRVQNNTIYSNSSPGFSAPLLVGCPANSASNGGQQVVVSNNNVIGFNVSASVISIIPSLQGSSGAVGKFIPPNASVFGNVAIAGDIFKGEISVVAYHLDTNSTKPFPGWFIDFNASEYFFSGLETSLNAKDTVLFSALTAPITLPTATINVASTAGFPTSGTVAVDDGSSNVFTVKYTGKVATAFTGCTGGYSSAPIVAANVYLAQSPRRNYETNLDMLHNFATLRNDGTY